MTDPFTPQSETIDLDGHAVEVSQLTAAAMLAMQRAEPDRRVFVLVAGSVQIDGRTVTAEQVAGWPGATLNRILPTALRLNGMDAPAEDDEAAGEGNDPGQTAAA